jgi:rhomboid family GlyGly-CTERM serine protease
MMTDGTPRPPAVREWRQEAAFPVAIAALLVLLWLGGGPVVEALRFERTAIAAGELWRLVSGNLVHASGQHLILNLAGLGLMALLFPGEYSRGEWSLIGLTSAMSIAAGLWWGSPEVGWYVGLSGVLHGLIAAGAIAWWRSRLRRMAMMLTAVLVAKLVGERLFGAIGWSGGLNVIIDAHLYGALGGAMAGVILCGLRKPVDSPEVPPGMSGPV